MLRYGGVVKRQRIRSGKDRRVFVLSVIVRYWDAHEYRKSFEVRAGEPIIPMQGTHEQLNAAKYQWTEEGRRAANELR